MLICAEPVFRYGSLCFRLVEEADLEQIRALRNGFSTWKQLTDPLPITRDGQRAWLARLGLRRDRMYFTVFDQVRPFVGYVRMDEYDRLHRSIRVGADVAPRFRGCGYGRRIIEAVKEYCFDTLNLHRVWLAVLETNGRARGLYESQGFREEGRYRKAIFREGKYVDYILMSILEEEYRDRS